MVVAFYFRLHLAYFPRPVVAIFARPEHAAPKEEETHSRLFLFVLHLLPLLPPEVDSQHDRGVNQRGGEDNEREVALHLVARRRETLDE